MILSIIIIGVTLGLTYLWLIRGFFNSFLHMLCVLAAGAIAFAAWEPVSYFLLGILPSTGALSFLQGSAWGIGLMIPFALAVVVLRLIVDVLVKANVTLNGAVEYVGAGVCGFVTATIGAGVFVIGLSHLPVSSEFLGYRPLWYNDDGAVGSLKKTDSLLYPADKITAGLYANLSTTVFASSQPLNRWYPDLHTTGFASRISPEDGIGRNTLQPQDFVLLSRYTVGDATNGSPAAELLVDIRDTEFAQPYADTNGDPVPEGYLAGFVIEFKPGAKERGERGAGPVSFSNGQIRLVVRDSEGNTSNVYPVAVVSQASAGETLHGRWRFDAPEVHIASVGGASNTSMAFEFMLRPDDEPIGLYVKGVRVNLERYEVDQVEYTSVAARDSVVTGGEILTGGQAATSNFDLSQAITVPAGDDISNNAQLGVRANIQTIARFFEINREDGNVVTSGEGEFEASEVDLRNSNIGASLLVDTFGVARDQGMVQIDVSDGKAASLLSTAAKLQPSDEPFRIIDQNGTQYDAVGYVYRDRNIYFARYTPAATLTGKNDIDAPALTNSRDDQSLKLLFIASKGVQIQHFAIGDVVLVTYDPPLDVKN